MSEITETLMTKKLGSYPSMNDYDNFVAEHEITVTITLSEYRHLVASDATRTKAIQEAENDKYTRLAKISELEKQVETLKALIGEKAVENNEDE